MPELFKSYPLGDPVNGSPHSVCVSLPTMADVIGYEEKDPKVLSSFTAGYPRFFRNPLITDLSVRLEQEGCMMATDPLLPSEAVARDLSHFLGLNDHSIAPIEEIWTIRLHGDPEIQKEAGIFLQHTGAGLSSREAGHFLQKWFDVPEFEEERRSGSAEENGAVIRSHLHSVYGTAAESDIRLFRSGMNAFYTGFRALQSIQMDRGRDLWIQLGWLYVDTARILERFALPNADPIQLYEVMDLSELKDTLAEHGHRVAGIVTEVPTNPLVQTPDVEQLRELADKYKAALILDPTLVSPHNLNVLKYADLHINSLTKYAASEADVMMGALALNAESPFYDDLLPVVSAFGSRPSDGDLGRMAIQIDRYPETIRQINASTGKIAEFLANHKSVDSIFWAHNQPAAYNYNWLQHREAGPGGIISFSLNKPVAEFYDPSCIVKSPSFGARFTMMCPFMYLAHYDMVKTAKGRAILKKHGIDPDLIRLSVGTEPVEAIIAELGRTL
ncbi:PLP-dependent transferase [Puniceicoccales bacterium CK1056]|uniref:PLP-dependent transferase n=1 Tax=Oceanipulchritudo coccoides TaxID=2706888 RepID=A0A6B2M280_9BACT|nr:PLP-dependent transferase [Oceanipulchritudo coccoides]NDV62244.1 PLP-dependent transferase [Oceanipulchritudo coccoides]